MVFREIIAKKIVRRRSIDRNAINIITIFSLDRERSGRYARIGPCMIANSAPPGIGVRTQNPAVAKRNLLLFSMYPMVPRPIHYRVCASLFPPLEMSILSVKSLVCVLWSRPGTPLIGPHGKRYASGTGIRGSFRARILEGHRGTGNNDLFARCTGSDSPVS